MDSRSLKAFIAVTETGSFSAAAENLHLTQPAISKRIALLEEQLGVLLFDRAGRQIAPTQAGQVLLPWAREILQAVTDAQRAIDDLQGEVRGKLSIATSHHIGLHRLPPWLKDFSRRYPDVKLDLHFLDSEQAYQEILQGRFDLAVITLAEEHDPRISSQPLWMDRLQFVAAPGHPLTARKHISIEDLSGFPAIMPDANTYTTRLVRKVFDQQQQTLDVTMVTNHLDTIKMMVSIGLGWGVLPETMLDKNLSSLDVDTPTLTRPLGCIYHRQRSLNNAASRFLESLKQTPAS
ncbi:LysR family transcriptional regulator [Cellvibrio polysaccharolyticus]|uniref:LysR family transcriptional regulator n=1 Tax=Cellvibrio polysaccharolyticus TaxID=2082724 RepID=A0A928YUN6_9GAMM|nr:LysR family transcriptional regulator [Cellvibrio polysaccharolyticus]MBE8717660.1 LysR family transcriptional regulator [Cellvibrio polysaccharolyticus]